MPVAYIMAGIPAAGKSTYVDHQIKQGVWPKEAFILDPDRTMQAMPEYQQALRDLGAEEAFNSYEIPAREKAYDLFEEAFAKRQDIIKDMGCTRMENIAMVRRLKQAGYAIHVTAMITDVETAWARVQQRERFTPKDMIVERYAALQDRLPDLKALADTYQEIRA